MLRSIALLICLFPTFANADVLAPHKKSGHVLNGQWIATVQCPLGSATITSKRLVQFRTSLFSPNFKGTFKDPLGRKGRMVGVLFGDLFFFEETIGGYIVQADGSFQAGAKTIKWQDTDGCKATAQRQSVTPSLGHRSR